MEVLQTLLSWSVTIPISFVGIFFLVWFRKPISRLIDRIKGLKTGPFDLDAGGQEAGTDIKPPSADKILKDHYQSPLIAEYLPILQKELKDLKLEEPADREKILIEALAAQRIIRIFEQTYSALFGSQIQALESLNVRGTVGVDTEDLHIFYDQAVVAFPDVYVEYRFEQWLEYLKSSGLVVKTENEVIISIVGIEFLRWMIQEGRSFNKPG